MALELIKEGNRFRIRTQDFSTQWLPDTASNRQMAVVWLRYWVDEKNKPVCTLQELAAIVDSPNRQAASQHVEDFRACGEDFRAFLTRQRKVDADVVACVREALAKEPLLEIAELVERVHAELGRRDITAANIGAALEQISCRVVLGKLRQQLTTGKVQYRESAVLEELLCETSVATRQKLGLPEPTAESGMTLADPSAIRALLTPDLPLGQVPGSLRWVSFMLVLFYWNVPLSVLGRWFGVHKTTVLRWMVGLALALWPTIYEWILGKVKATMVYVDEKWIKIRGRWYYWYVVLDAHTELPVLAALLGSRTQWAVRWVDARLKQLKKIPQVVITDGLLAYGYLCEKAKHIRCRFHHQQRVTVWLQKHFTEAADIDERKAEMKAVLQTDDKRTVKRRLAKLQKKAAAWGITEWVERLVEKLPTLLPSVGSVRIPSTTNAIERFFRVFNRFYKTRAGFHSVVSAKRALILFLVVYLFTQREGDGKAPIEAIVPEAARMPLYRLVNDPLHALGALKNVKKTDAMADFLLAKAVAE